ncbi:S-adenosyl-L-methionine-dependent methyltransferase [Dactylonectria macrodidyma]|uniref:S-adenosyl-L-methionine-dependent methyltransferase n=1 Tax=Dactylonectria macrodidyma TaxID=307937 RepID=A0A9P9IL11_9HYPO|nr:S-adenosyl-L-methionine-dependent methyltransferase [Dactylonectria macrodidyma]
MCPEDAPALAADPVVEPDDNDSSLGNDAASSTESISSSILNYRRENGRTYHRYKDGKYNLPNDDVENERLDFQHHQWLLTLGDGLGLAPPNKPNSGVKRVLDLGCGTGIWVVDFADEHPEAEVTGIDLSPIQPDFVPPNVRFIIDDIDEEWTYSAPFDYIHSRAMNFSVKNWNDYLQNIYDNLVPGGFVEVQEIDVMLTSDDGTLTEDHDLLKWCTLLNQASVMVGRPCESFENLKIAMTNVGFVDVSLNCFKWPINPWPKDKKHKEIGAWNKVNWEDALEALSMAPFTRIHGWSKEEVTVLLAKVRKDLVNPAVHAYTPVCSIYGRKREVELETE